MKKETSVRLTKNPEYYLYTRNMFNYVVMLEDTGRLSELPKNLFVYYVISLFADEADNGGIGQYITNSSKKTYPFLRVCAKYLAHKEISPFICEVCDYIDSFPPDTESDEFFAGLEPFDNRFFEIQKKHEIQKIALKYYRENFEVERITIPVLKQKESDTCGYFTVAKEEKCRDAEVAAKAFLDILSSFEAQRWSIELCVYGDTFNVTASSFGEILDLKKILAEWGKNDALRMARGRICDFIKEVRFSTYPTVGEDIYHNYVHIEPDGYEKNEYMLKYYSLKETGATNVNPGENEIILFHISRTKKPGTYEKMKAYWENNYSNYPNIEKFFERIAW